MLDRAMGSDVHADRLQWRPLLVFVLLVGTALSILVLPFGGEGSGVGEGARAAETYVARHDAEYVSEVATNQRRDEAARAVADVYSAPDPAVAQQQATRLRAFLDAIASIRARNLNATQQLSEAAGAPGASGLSQSLLGTILAFDASTYADFDQRATRAVNDILSLQVQPQRVADRVRDYLDANRPDQTNELAALRELLGSYIVSNVTVDQAATQAARQQARDRVDPVPASYTAGQVIVPQGTLLTAADIEALRQTGILRDGFNLYKAAGGLIVAFGVASVLGLALARMQPFTRPARARLAVVGVVLVLGMTMVRLSLPAILPDADDHGLAYALPVAAIAVTASVLGGFPIALLFAVVSGLLSAFIGSAYPHLTGTTYQGPLEEFTLAAVTICAGAAGAACVSRRHRALTYLAAGVVMTAAAAGVLGTQWLISEPRENRELPFIGAAALAHGVGAALAVAVILAILGRRLGLSLRRELMRLSQPNHPLLRQLQDEAPGTYHHSQMVATMAEAAARRIGADALLARVGATFHDIGKIERPRYFVENQLDDGVSPHETLAPDVSALLIREHVSNGLALAKEHGLPPAVQDFIPEHHGTRLVTYFYRQAVAAAAPGVVVDPEDYRYRGPRPQSRETAIVMLADSSEAAVRANTPSSQAQIEMMIDEIIRERLAEGQLDDCELTMGQLREIAASFKETLRAVYHPRIPYPAVTPEELLRIASG
jgi:putative nucleotidyltransferase with HDIG domain